MAVEFLHVEIVQRSSPPFDLVESRKAENNLKKLVLIFISFGPELA